MKTKLRVGDVVDLRVWGLIPELRVHSLLYENCVVKEDGVYSKRGKYCEVDEVNGYCVVAENIRRRSDGEK